MRTYLTAVEKASAGRFTSAAEFGTLPPPADADPTPKIVMPISVRFAPRLLLAVSLVPSLLVASMAGCQGEATGVVKTTPAAPIPTVAATAEPTTPTMGDAAAPAPQAPAKPAAPKTAPTP
ncbi:MAG: hypothetical protein KC731_34910, partial [Myxococcales bacterium]|nr:hypothetical protein [Myxococcales bacterium]